MEMRWQEFSPRMGKWFCKRQIISRHMRSTACLQLFSSAITGFYNGIGKTRFVMIQGILGAFASEFRRVLYYEHPAGNIAVSYRAGNADVVSLAVDSLRWIHALFEKKKGMLDDKKI